MRTVAVWIDVDPRSGVPIYVQIVEQVRHALDVMGTPILEENGPEDFKGIDIMRAVRSFDPAVRGARLDGRSKRLEGAYERSGRGPRRGF